MTQIPANWSFKDRSLGYVHNKGVVKKAQRCTFSTFYFVQIALMQGTPCQVGSVEAVYTICLLHRPKKYILTLSPAIFSSEVFFCQRMLENHLILQTYHNWHSCSVMQDTQIVSSFAVNRCTVAGPLSISMAMSLEYRKGPQGTRQRSSDTGSAFQKGYSLLPQLSLRATIHSTN